MEKLEQEVQEGNITKGHPMLDKKGEPNENMVRKRSTKGLQSTCRFKVGGIDSK